MSHMTDRGYYSAVPTVCAFDTKKKNLIRLLLCVNEKGTQTEEGISEIKGNQQTRKRSSLPWGEQLHDGAL